MDNRGIDQAGEDQLDFIYLCEYVMNDEDNEYNNYPFHNYNAVNECYTPDEILKYSQISQKFNQLFIVIASKTLSI